MTDLFPSPLSDFRNVDLHSPFVGGDPVLRGYRPYGGANDTSMFSSNSIHQTYLGESVKALKVFDKVMTRDQLAGIDGGPELLMYADKLASGRRRGLADAVTERFSSLGGLASTIVPYVGGLAKVGGDFVAAARAANTMERLTLNGMQGEVSDEERVALQTYLSQNDWEASSTLAAKVSEIVLDAPALAVEMGASSMLSKAAVTAIPKITGKTPRFLAMNGAERTTARGAAVHAKKLLTDIAGMAADDASAIAARESFEDMLKAAAPTRLAQWTKAIKDAAAHNKNYVKETFFDASGKFTKAGADYIKAVSSEIAGNAHITAAITGAYDNAKLMTSLTTAITRSQTDEITRLLKPYVDNVASSASPETTQVLQGLLDTVISLTKSGDAAAAKNAADTLIAKSIQVKGLDQVTEAAIKDYVSKYVDLSLNLSGKKWYSVAAMHTLGWLKDHAIRGAFEHYDKIEMLGFRGAGELQNALGLLTVEPMIKGVLYGGLIGTAVRVPLSLALTGGSRVLPLTRGELAAKGQAFAAQDKGLMERSFWVGLGQMMVEMASETSGEAFTALGRHFINSSRPLGFKVNQTLADRFRAFVDAKRITEGYLQAGRENAMSLRRWISAFTGETHQNAFRVELLKKKAITDFLTKHADDAKATLGGVFTPEQVMADSGLFSKAYAKAKEHMSAKALKNIFLYETMQKAGKKFSWANLYSPTGIRKMLEHVGFDGMLEEWLEERYGGFWQYVFHVDGQTESDREKYSWARGALAATLPDFEQGIAELIAFSVPGVMARNLMMAQAALGTGSLSRFSDIMERSEAIVNHSMAVVDGFSTEEEKQQVLAAARNATKNLPEDQASAGSPNLDSAAGAVAQANILEGSEAVGAEITHVNEDLAGDNTQVPASKKEIDQLNEDLVDACIEYERIIDETKWNTEPSFFTKALHKILGLVVAASTGQFAAVRWNPVYAMAQTWSGGREFLTTAAAIVRNAKARARAIAASELGAKAENIADNILDDPEALRVSAAARAGAAEDLLRGGTQNRQASYDRIFREIARAELMDLISRKRISEGALRISMDGSINEAAARLVDAHIKAAQESGAMEVAYVNPLGQKVTKKLPETEEGRKALRDEIIAETRIALAVRFLGLATDGTLRYSVARDQRNQRTAQIVMAADAAANNPNSEVAVFQSQLDAALASTPEFNGVQTFMHVDTLAEAEGLAERLTDFGSPLEMSRVANVSMLDPDDIERMSPDDLASDPRFEDLAVLARQFKVIHANNPVAMRNAYAQIIRTCKMLNHRYQLSTTLQNDPNALGAHWYRELPGGKRDVAITSVRKVNDQEVHVLDYLETADDGTVSRTSKVLVKKVVDESTGLAEWVDPEHPNENAASILAANGYNPVRPRFIFTPCSTVTFSDPLVAVNTMRGNTYSQFMATASGQGFSSIQLETTPNPPATGLPFQIFRSNGHLAAARKLVESYEANQNQDAYALQVLEEEAQNTDENGKHTRSTQDNVDVTYTLTRSEAANFAREFRAAEALAKDVLLTTMKVSDAYSTDGSTVYECHVANLSNKDTVVVPFDPVFTGTTTAAVTWSLVYNRIKSFVGRNGRSLLSDGARDLYKLDDIVGSLLAAADTRLQALMTQWEGPQAQTLELESQIVGLQNLANSLRGGMTERLLADIITNITFGYGQWSAAHGNAVAGQSVWGDIAEIWLKDRNNHEARSGKFMLDMITAVLFSGTDRSLLGTPEGHQACFNQFFDEATGAYHVYAAPGTLEWFSGGTMAPAEQVVVGGQQTPVQAPAQAPQQATPQAGKTPAPLSPEALKAIIDQLLVPDNSSDSESRLTLPDFYRSLRSAVKGGESGETPQDDNNGGSGPAEGDSFDFATSDRTQFSELPLQSVVAIADALVGSYPEVFATGLDNVQLTQELRKRTPHIGATMDDNGRDAQLLVGTQQLFGSESELKSYADAANKAEAAAREATQKAQENSEDADLQAAAVAAETAATEARDALEKYVRDTLGRDGYGVEDALSIMNSRATVSADEELNEDENDEAANAKDGDGGFDRTTLQELEATPEWQTLKFLFAALFPATKNNIAAATRLLLDEFTAKAARGNLSKEAGLFVDLLRSRSKVSHSALFAKKSPQDIPELERLAGAENTLEASRILFSVLRHLPKHRYNRIILALANIVEVAGVDATYDGEILDDTSGRLTQTSDNLYYLAGLELLSNLRKIQEESSIIMEAGAPVQKKTYETFKAFADTLKNGRNGASWMSHLASSKVFSGSTAWRQVFSMLSRYTKDNTLAVPGRRDASWATLDSLVKAGNVPVPVSLLSDLEVLWNAASNSSTTLSGFVDVLKNIGAAQNNPETLNGSTPLGNKGTLTQILNAYVMCNRAGRKTSDGTTTELNRASLSLAQEVFIQSKEFKELRDTVKNTKHDSDVDLERFAEWTRGEPVFTHVVSPYMKPYDFLVNGILATEAILRANQPATANEGEPQGVNSFEVDTDWIHFQLYTGDRGTLASMRVPRIVYQALLKKTLDEGVVTAESSARDRYVAVSKWLATRMGLGQIGPKRTQIVAAEQTPIDLGYKSGETVIAPRVLCVLSKTGENETLFGSGALVSPDGLSEDPLLATEMPGANSTKVHLVGYNNATGRYEMIKGNFLCLDKYSDDLSLVHTSDAWRALHKFASRHANDQRTRVILTDFDGTKVGPLASDDVTVSVEDFVPPTSEEGAKTDAKDPLEKERGILKTNFAGLMKAGSKFGVALSKAIYALHDAGVNAETITNLLLTMVKVKAGDASYDLGAFMPNLQVVEMSKEESPSDNQTLAISYGGKEGADAPFSYRALKAANLFHESSPSSHPIAKNTLNDLITSYKFIEDVDHTDVLFGYTELATLVCRDPDNQERLVALNPDLERSIELARGELSVEAEIEKHLNAAIIKAMRPAGARIKAILVASHAKASLNDKGEIVVSDANYGADDKIYNRIGDATHVGLLRANIRDARVRYGSFFVGTVNDVNNALNIGRKKTVQYATLDEAVTAAVKELAGLDSYTAESKTKGGEQPNAAKRKDALLKLFKDCYGQQMTLTTHGKILWGDAVGGATDTVITKFNEDGSDKPKLYAGGAKVDGDAKFYVSGTIVPFPRTPSGNAGPVFTSLRLSTPVTVEKGKTKTQDNKDVTTYAPGVDSFAIPPPDATWRQGSDHDGDTAMINLPFNGRTVIYSRDNIEEALEFRQAIVDAVKVLREMRKQGEPILIAKLSAPGNDPAYTALAKVLAVNKKGVITIKPTIQRAIGALYAAMFTRVSLLRTTPESTTGKTLYTKEWGVGTVDAKSLVLPYAMDGDKRTLEDPFSVAMVTASGRDASTARGSIVAGIAALHTCARIGFYPFDLPSNHIWDHKQFVGLIRELDPYANSLFDDLKEQIALRLRLNPNTNDAFLGMVLNRCMSMTKGTVPTREIVNEVLDRFVSLFDGTASVQVGTDKNGKPVLAKKPFSGNFGIAMMYTFGFLKNQYYIDLVAKEYFPEVMKVFDSGEGHTSLYNLISLAGNRELALQLEAASRDDKAKTVTLTDSKGVHVTVTMAAVKQAMETVRDALGNTQMEDVMKTDLARAMLAQTVLTLSRHLGKATSDKKSKVAVAEVKSGLADVIKGLATMSHIHRVSAAYSLYKATNSSSRVVTSANTPISTHGGQVYYVEPSKLEAALASENPPEPVGVIVGPPLEDHMASRNSVINVAGITLTEEAVVNSVREAIAQEFPMRMRLYEMALDDPKWGVAAEWVLSTPIEEIEAKYPDQVKKARESIVGGSVGRQGILDAARMSPAAHAAADWLQQRISEHDLDLIFAVGARSETLSGAPRSTLAFLRGVEGLFTSMNMGLYDSIKALTEKGNLSEEDRQTLKNLETVFHVFSQFSLPQYQDPRSRRLRITPVSSGVSAGRLVSVQDAIEKILKGGYDELPLFLDTVESKRTPVALAVHATVAGEGDIKLTGEPANITNRDTIASNLQASAGGMISVSGLLRALALYSTITSRSRPTTDAGAGSLLDFFPEGVRREIFTGAGEAFQTAYRDVLTLASSRDNREPISVDATSLQVLAPLFMGLPSRYRDLSGTSQPTYGGTPYVNIDRALAKMTGVKKTSTPKKTTNVQPVAKKAIVPVTYPQYGAKLTVNVNDDLELEGQPGVFHKGAIELVTDVSQRPADISEMAGDIYALGLDKLQVVSYTGTQPVGAPVSGTVRSYKFAIPFVKSETADKIREALSKIHVPGVDSQSADGKKITSPNGVITASVLPQTKDDPAWLQVVIEPDPSGVNSRTDLALAQAYSEAMRLIVNEYRAMKKAAEEASKTVTPATVAKLVFNPGDLANPDGKAITNIVDDVVDRGLSVGFDQNEPLQILLQGSDFAKNDEFDQGLFLGVTDQEGDHKRLVLKFTDYKVGKVTLSSLANRILKNMRYWVRSRHEIGRDVKISVSDRGMVEVVVRYDVNKAPTGSPREDLFVKVFATLVARTMTASSQPVVTPMPTAKNNTPITSNLRPAAKNRQPMSPEKANEKIVEALDDAYNTLDGILWTQIQRIFEQREGSFRVEALGKLVQKSTAQETLDAMRSFDPSAKAPSELEQVMYEAPSEDDPERTLPNTLPSEVAPRVQKVLSDVYKDLEGFFNDLGVPLAHHPDMAAKVKNLISMAWKAHAARLSSWKVGTEEDGSTASSWPSRIKVAQLVREALSKGRALNVEEVCGKIKAAKDALDALKKGLESTTPNATFQSTFNGRIDVNAAKYAYAHALQAVLLEFTSGNTDPFDMNNLGRIEALLSLLNFEDLSKPVSGVLTPGYEELMSKEGSLSGDLSDRRDPPAREAYVKAIKPGKDKTTESRAAHVMSEREKAKFDPMLRADPTGEGRFFPWSSNFGAAQTTTVKHMLQDAFSKKSAATLSSNDRAAFFRNLTETLLLRTTPYIERNVTQNQVAAMLSLLDALQGDAGVDLRAATSLVRDAVYGVLALRSTARIVEGDKVGSDVRAYVDGALSLGVPGDSPISKIVEAQDRLLANDEADTGGFLRNLLSLTSAQSVLDDGVVTDDVTSILLEMDPHTAFEHFTLPKATGKFDLRETMMFSSGENVATAARDLGRFYDQLLGVSDINGRIPTMVEEDAAKIEADKGVFRLGKKKDFHRIRFIDPARETLRPHPESQRFTPEEAKFMHVVSRAMSAWATGGSEYLYTGIGNAAVHGYPFEIDLVDIRDLRRDGTVNGKDLDFDTFCLRYSKAALEARHLVFGAGVSGTTSSLSVWLHGLYRSTPEELLKSGTKDGLEYKILSVIHKAATQAVSQITGATENLPDIGRHLTEAVVSELKNQNMVRESLVRDRRGRRVTTLVIPVNDILREFGQSSAKRKLMSAGRKENMLTKEYAKELAAPVLQELAKFRMSNPEIFRGELGYLMGAGDNFWLSDGMGMLSKSEALKNMLLREGRKVTSDGSESDTFMEHAVGYARSLVSKAGYTLFKSTDENGRTIVGDDGVLRYRLNSKFLTDAPLRLYDDLCLKKVSFSDGNGPGGQAKKRQDARLTSAGDKHLFTAQELADMGLVDLSSVGSAARFSALPPDVQDRLVRQTRISHLSKVVYEAVVARDLARLSGGTNTGTEEDAEATKFRHAFELSPLPYEGKGPTRVGATMDEAFLYGGSLPTDAGLGTMLKMMAQTVAQACAFTGTLHNMLMTRDMYGKPNYLLVPTDAPGKPSDLLSDRYWGELAKFYIAMFPDEAKGLTYRPSDTGRANARRIAKAIQNAIAGARRYVEMKDDTAAGDRTGTIDGVDHIYCLVPNTPDAKGRVYKDDQHFALNTKGEAYGYLKSLLALKAFKAGHVTLRAIDHILTFTKMANVWGSFFFPIATGFESPVAASGLLMTLGKFKKLGANDALHDAADNDAAMAQWLNDSGRAFYRLLHGQDEETAKKQGFEDGFNALTIADIASAWESNDPGLIQLKRLCTSCGITLSTPGQNTFYDHNTKEWRNALDRWSEKLSNLVGKAGIDLPKEKASGFFRSIMTDFSEQAFTHMMNITAIAVASQLLSRLRAWAIQEGRYFDPVKELRKVGNYINEEVGGINPLAHAFATPAFRGIFDRAMFSWKWTMGSWSAGGGTMLSNALLGGDATTPLLRNFFLGRWLRMYLWVMHGGPFLFQMLITAIGKAVVDGLGDDDDKKRFRPDLYKWFYWNNEERGRMAWDYTPLLDAMAVLDKKYTGGHVAASKRGEYDRWWNLSLPSVLARLAPMTADMSTPFARRHYGRGGKQGSEVMRYFMGMDECINQLFSKLNIPLQQIITVMTGENPVSHFEADWKMKGYTGFNKLASQTKQVMSSALPFSFGSFSSFPEAGVLATVGPVSRGLGTWTANEKLKSALLAYARNAKLSAGKPKFHRLRANLSEILADMATNGLDPEAALTTTRAQVAKMFYEQAYTNRPRPGAKPNAAFLEAVAALRALGVKPDGALASFRQRHKRETSGRKHERSDMAHKVAEKALREGLGPSTSLFEDDPVYLQQDNKGGNVFAPKKVLTVAMPAPKTVLGVKVRVNPEDPDDDPNGPKGPGPNVRKVLASDKLPQSIFGIQVVMEPHEYFDQDPRVPGFYEMGDEGPVGQADEKGGYIDDLYTEDEVESRWVNHQYHEDVDRDAKEDNWNGEVDLTDQFNTVLPEGREYDYFKWREDNNVDEGYDYDYVGAFLAGEGRGDYANGHLSDRFKKPNHPTYDPRGSIWTIDKDAAMELGINRRQWVDRSKFIYREPEGGEAPLGVVGESLPVGSYVDNPDQRYKDIAGMFDRAIRRAVTSVRGYGDIDYSDIPGQDDENETDRDNRRYLAARALVGETLSDGVVRENIPGSLAAHIDELTPEMIKRWILHETRGEIGTADPYNTDTGARLGTFVEDPAQINAHQGDWDDAKLDFDLVKPGPGHNTGWVMSRIIQNVREEMPSASEEDVREEAYLRYFRDIAIPMLVRKGYGASYKPLSQRAYNEKSFQGNFDGWRAAFRRFNGNKKKDSNGREHRDNYADTIMGILNRYY